MPRTKMRYSADRRESIRSLRRDGMSINAIAMQEGLASSTVYIWVRDIELTAAQREAITHRRAVTAGDRFAAAMQARRDQWRTEARAEWAHLRTDPLFLLGVGMYWGEGDKTQRRLAITNAEPNFIRTWLRWCSTYISSPQFVLHVLIYPDLDQARVKEFWQDLAGPEATVYVTSVPAWKKRTDERPRLAYGVARAQVAKAGEWHAKMLEWLSLAGVM